MQNYIDLLEIIITEDRIKFSSNCTSYANEFRSPTYDIKEMLKRFTVITKAVKDAGGKISNKHKSRKYVADSKDLYLHEMKEYNTNFDRLFALASLITSKPLPTGTSDNQELNTMYKYRNACMKACNRNTIKSSVENFSNRLDEIEQQLKDDNNFSGVTIYF
jgi:shikimate kinase